MSDKKLLPTPPEDFTITSIENMAKIGWTTIELEPTEVKPNDHIAYTQNPTTGEIVVYLRRWRSRYWKIVKQVKK